MAGPLTPQQAQLTAVFGGSGIPTGAVVTLGLHHTAEFFDQPDLDALASLLTAVHKATSCDSCVLEHVELKSGPTTSGPTMTKSVNEAGGVGSGQAPPNVCLLVQKSLQGISAKFSGRLFWPGIHEASIDAAGALASTYITAVQNSWNAFFTGISGRDITPVVFTDSQPNLMGFNIVNRFGVQPKVATQRRRLRR